MPRHEPDEAAIEETFVNTDARATLKLGQARGVAMLAPAMLAFRVAEYAPNMIKKSVVGAGHAEKDQVKHMVKLLLPRAQLNTRGFDRCAGHRHLPCPPPGGPDPGQDSGAFLTCSSDAWQ